MPVDKSAAITRCQPVMVAIRLQQRAAALEEVILQTSDGALNRDQIRTTHSAENWEGLLAAVREGYFRHDREKVIRILSDSSIGDETRKWRLKQLDGGYTWNFLYRRYMPVLRQAVITGISYSSFTPLAACCPKEQMSVRADVRQSAPHA